ncbi:MAG: hypothetical protein JXL20_00385 [Deltaproteobacteria bacterium]|nr:hypothetical protein [Deltaproteobacteria bacterium]
MNKRAGDIAMIRYALLLFTFLSFFLCSTALALDESGQKALGIYAIVKDSQDSVLEGYISDQPREVTVSSADNQEKQIPSKYIKSITLEKMTDPGAAAPDPKQEAQYSVRLENSREIYTLRQKYTFSLNTSIGVVTRSIDPETIKNIISSDISNAPNQKSPDNQSWIRDKSIIFSLELKF